MPAWAWAVLVLGGAGGIGGWLALASQKPPAPQVAAAPVAPQAENGDDADAATAGPAAPDSAAATKEESKDNPAGASVEPADAPVASEPAADAAIADAPATAVATTDETVAAAGEADDAPGEDAAVEPVAEEIYSAERLLELAAACEAFSWSPTTAEQYLQMAQLARQMTWAKSDTATADGEEAAEQTFAKLQALDWSETLRAAVGKFAGESAANDQEGIFLAGTVVTSLKDQDGKDGLLIEADSTNENFFVYVDAANAFEPSGAHWIVLGKLLPETITAPGKDNTQVVAHRVEQFYKFKVSN